MGVNAKPDRSRVTEQAPRDLGWGWLARCGQSGQCRVFAAACGAICKGRGWRAAGITMGGARHLGQLVNSVADTLRKALGESRFRQQGPRWSGRQSGRRSGRRLVDSARARRRTWCGTSSSRAKVVRFQVEARSGEDRSGGFALGEGRVLLEGVQDGQRALVPHLAPAQLQRP